MLVRLEAPTQHFLERELVKKHIRVTTTADDDRIDSLIEAVEAVLDGQNGYLGRALMPQTWRLDMHDWPDNAILVPLPPLISVESIEYLDSTGDLQTLPASYYRVVDGAPVSMIVPEHGKTWPSVLTAQRDAVQVTFVAGYQDTLSPTNNAVPGAIVQAGVILLGMLYDTPMDDIPDSVKSILAPWVVHQLGTTYAL